MNDRTTRPTSRGVEGGEEMLLQSVDRCSICMEEPHTVGFSHPMEKSNDQA